MDPSRLTPLCRLPWMALCFVLCFASCLSCELWLVHLLAVVDGVSPGPPSNDTQCPVLLPATSSSSVRFDANTLLPGLYLFRLSVARGAPDVASTLGVDAAAQSALLVPAELQARASAAFVYANVLSTTVRRPPLERG